MTFTCDTSTGVFNWAVTPDGGSSTSCVVLREPMISITTPTCGPMDEFLVGASDDGSNSTLSAQSVDDSLNGTRIQCLDGDVNQEICIIGWYISTYTHVINYVDSSYCFFFALRFVGIV